MIYWCDILIRCIETIYWYDILIQYIDMRYWYDILIWFTGIICWSNQYICSIGMVLKPLGGANRSDEAYPQWYIFFCFTGWSYISKLFSREGNGQERKTVRPQKLQKTPAVTHNQGFTGRSRAWQDVIMRLFYFLRHLPPSVSLMM
jgi:hypothetical protein